MNIEQKLEMARSLDRDRLELDRQSKDLKKQVETLSAEIISEMHALGATELHGSRIVVKQKPYISDWSLLDLYIRENDATDLLQRRLTESAVKLRWDDGIAVPGVGTMTEEKLQL